MRENEVHELLFHVQIVIQVIYDLPLKKKQPPQLNGPSGSLTHFYQLGALLLRKGIKCHSPIQQLFSASSSFVFFYLLTFFFQLYMYLFGYDFNNFKYRGKLNISFSLKLFPYFHIQMVVMFFQRFIFPAKTFRGKYSEHIWVFHCRQSIRKKPKVLVLAVPSEMMQFGLGTKLLRYSRRDFLEKIDVPTENRTWAIR